jgi:hypothetical protein
MINAKFMRKRQVRKKFYLDNKFKQLKKYCTASALGVKNIYQFIEVYLTILIVFHLFKNTSNYLTNIHKFFISKMSGNRFMANFGGNQQSAAGLK